MAHGLYYLRIGDTWLLLGLSEVVVVKICWHVLLLIVLTAKDADAAEGATRIVFDYARFLALKQTVNQSVIVHARSLHLCDQHALEMLFKSAKVFFEVFLF